MAGTRDRNSGSSYDEDDDDDGGESVDLSVLKDYLGYAVRALRLHKVLAACVFVCCVAGTFGILRTLPRTWHIETKVIAQKEVLLGQGNPFGSEPMKGVSDIVMGHEHLLSLVKQLDLTAWWRQHLSPAQRFKARIMETLFRAPTEEEQVKILIDILSTRMNAVQGDGSVTITLDWPNGEMGARILDTAEQNFLEKRHVFEISTIAESISIHEQHAARVRKEIEELTQSEKKTLAAEAPKRDVTGKQAAVAAPAAPVHRVQSRRPEVDAELARQKVLIDTKQRAISDLEDFRRRRIQDLQASLVEQQSKYTEQHPIIVGIQQSIAAISKESPQVAALRSEVKTLQEAYERMSREAEGEGAEKRVGGGPATAGPPPTDVSALVIPPAEGRDPAMEAQISYAVATYSKIRADISAASIDLDLAQAAFRHRYTITQPPEPPRAPIKPKVPLIMAAAVIGGLLLAILAAVASELRTGRLVYRWQVQRSLKLPILAELQLPATSSGRPEDRK